MFQLCGTVCWHRIPNYHCGDANNLAITLLVSTSIHRHLLPATVNLMARKYSPADLVSDILLVIVPFRMLWSMKIARGARRLILAVFAASILTTLTGIAHVYYMFTCDTYLQALTLHLEVSIVFPHSTRVTYDSLFQVVVSLLVCNMLVVVTYLYRVFRSDEEPDFYVSEDVSPPLASRTEPLTSGDFNFSSQYTNSSSLNSQMGSFGDVLNSPMLTEKSDPHTSFAPDSEKTAHRL